MAHNSQWTSGFMIIDVTYCWTTVSKPYPAGVVSKLCSFDWKEKKDCFNLEFRFLKNLNKKNLALNLGTTHMQIKFIYFEVMCDNLKHKRELSSIAGK